MLDTYFQNLPAVIGRHLSNAQSRIQIAVCWFSHRDIFEVLLKKQRASVGVELLLEYDSQNIRAEGLDFQKLIRLGSPLYAYRDAALMHHKFALLDDRVLLTGSFNWTYNSNAENLLATDDPAAVVAFREEFNRLKGLSVPIRKVRPSEAKAFAAFPLFQHTHFQLSDLRRRISGGATVWWMRQGRQLDAWSDCFGRHRLPIDPGHLLRRYWSAFRLWDEALLDACWAELVAEAKPATVRHLRACTRRMRLGDIVLAVAGKNALCGLGIVQSEPKPPDAHTPVSFREVQWLRTLDEVPECLRRDFPPGKAGRFRGSALQVVQVIFESG